MDMNRLQSWIAAPFVAMLLILTVWVMAAPRAEPVGVYFPILRLAPTTPPYSCDGRFVFVQLLANGETRINGRLIPQDNDLGPLVRTIMAPRAERVVYVVPDSQIQYGRFVEALSILHNATTDLHLGVLSGRLRDEYFKRGLEPCDLVWPQEELRSDPQ
jgi:biopolymer transport protein ExbD